jgi:TonB family protein
MNPHLSSQQFSQILIGIGEPAIAGHARECSTCSMELQRLELPLTWFRTAARQWSHQMENQTDKQFIETRFETAPVLLLTPESLDLPWYRGILQAIRDAIHPPDAPPLKVTSKPIAVPDLWGFYGGNEKTAGFTSVLIHACVIALILFIGSLKPVQKMLAEHIALIAPDVKPYKPEVNKGGGGGGAKAPLDASKGKLPKIAPRQFTPPRVDTVQARLPMTPTIVSDVPIPNIDAMNYGDTLSKLGVPSNGTGLGGGIGTGTGGGVGSGHGVGVGPGSGAGIGGGAYRIGGGVSQPTLLTKVEPEYSEEARKAKWQGTVLIEIVVDEHGLPKEMKVTRALGLGLDQKALEAVAKWRFKPGTKDGKPVPVIATVEVNFRLL